MGISPPNGILSCRLPPRGTWTRWHRQTWVTSALAVQVDFSAAGSRAPQRPTEDRTCLVVLFFPFGTVHCRKYRNRVILSGWILVPSDLQSLNSSFSSPCVGEDLFQGTLSKWKRLNTDSPSVFSQRQLSDQAAKKAMKRLSSAWCHLLACLCAEFISSVCCIVIRPPSKQVISRRTAYL